MNVAQEASASSESGFPRYWDWDEDGLTAAGTYVKIDSAATQFGTKAIIVLEIDGEERSVWVNQEALRSKLGAELERRKARDFNLGERLIIRRGAEKKMSANDRNYWPFALECLTVRAATRRVFSARTSQQTQQQTSGMTISRSKSASERAALVAALSDEAAPRLDGQP